MIRNLKTLGLVLIAVVAMSVTVASAASAGELTSDGPVKLQGEESNFTLTMFGQKLECQNKIDWGKVNETPHGFVFPPLTTFTLKYTFSNCTAFIGELKAPATVTMNGCDLAVHIGVKIKPLRFHLIFDFVCEFEKFIEIHAYSSAAHSSSVCTYKIPAQTGLVGGTIENVAGGRVSLGGPVTGIKATRTGILCGGTAETSEAKQDIGAEISGTNEAGSATAIEVSGS